MTVAVHFSCIAKKHDRAATPRGVVVGPACLLIGGDAQFGRGLVAVVLNGLVGLQTTLHGSVYGDGSSAGVALSAICILVYAI